MNFENHAEQIQAAINYAARCKIRLVFNSGYLFNISSTIKIPSYFEINFNFSTIRRMPGKVFNMMENLDIDAGNSNINLTNLIVDGNSKAANRVATNLLNRFGGVVFFNASSSTLRDVTVNGAVNAEDRRAEIYFNGCKEIDENNIGG